MNDYNIFYNKIDKNEYLFDVANGKSLVDILKEIKNKKKKFYKIYLPLDVDNEWQGLHPKYRDIILAKNRGRLIIKAQTRPLKYSIEDTIVNNHWDVLDFPELNIPIRYEVLQKGIGYAAIQLLNSIPGVEATLYLADDKAKKDKLKQLKKEGKIFSFVEYAHFGLVDFLPRFEGKFKKSIETFYRSESHQKILFRKHHFTELKFTTNEGHTVKCNFIRPNWILVINGFYFAVELELHDSSAVIGEAGRALISLAPSSNVNMPYKDILKDVNGKPLDKGLYLDIYSTPEYFDIEDKYSKGDCVAYQCLEGMNKLYEKIDIPLKIEDRTGVLPKTLGSNTAKRIKARWEVLAEDEGVDAKNKVNLKILKQAYSSNSAEELCKNPLNTISILGKGFGGRCFLNKPRLVTISSVLMDADAKSAYVSIMMRQPIGLGISQKVSYPIDGELNKCLSLEKFYKKYEKELVEHNYQLIITVGTGKINDPEILELPEHCDYFFSYKPPVKWSNIAIPEDLEKPLFKLPDQIAIRTKSLINTVFTHSEYEILMNMCSPKLRAFIMKNARVIAANFYPRSKQVFSINEVLQNFENGLWYQTTIGDLIISILKEKRDYYKSVTSGMKILKECNFNYQNLDDKQKEAINTALTRAEFNFNELVEAACNFSKFPLDNLNKYAGNCVFGSIQSPYFMIGNIISGNNITAQCRQYVIAMEKFLNLGGAITDGQVGDTNKVTYPKESTLNNRQLCRVDSYTTQELNQKLAVQYKPLGDYSKIEWESETSNNVIFHNKDKTIITKDLNNATKEISKLANEHVKKLGKGLSTTEFLEIELKGLQRKLGLHGQSNYILKGGSHELYKKGQDSLIAMRSYPKETEGYAYNFLHSILNNPKSVPRQHPFEMEYILKPNEYKIRWKTTYSKKCFIPGDGVFKVAWIREYSPSGMIFNLDLQADNWEKEYVYLKSKYGQSYEYFFLNDDGTVNYLEMIQSLDTIILAGYNSYSEYLQKTNPKYSSLKSHKELVIDYHPYWEEYQNLKKYLDNLGVINNEKISENSDWDDIDWENIEPFEEGNEEDANYINIADEMTAEEIESLFDDIEINI